MAKKVLKYHYRPPQKVKLRKRDINNGIFVGILLLFVVFVLSVSNILPSNLVGFATAETPNGKIIVDVDGNNIVLKLNTNTKTVNGVYVEMNVSELCTKYLTDVSKVEGKLWGEFKDVKCTNDKLTFGDATLGDGTKPGEFVVLQFPSAGFPQTFTITIPKIDVYDTSDGKDLFEDKDYNFKVDLSSKSVKDETKNEAPTAPSGGGGTYCTPNWKCTDWSYCNNQLKQERVCSDIKGCQKNKAESRACAKCDESWQCSAWSSCSYNQQTRKCYEEHKCGTTTKKPVETKSCTEVVPVVQQPEQQYYQPPVQEYQQSQEPVVQQPVELSFFDKYMTYLLAIPFVLLFIIILVLGVMHFTKRTPQTSFNYTELKDWMKKERAAGASDDEIRDILAQNTGWKSEEISRMFGELGK